MFDIGKEAMISLNHLLSGEKEFNFHKLIPVDYISRETTR